MQIQRRPDSFRLRSVRSLERSDLVFLQEKSARPSIQHLRDSHHIVARLLASGLTQSEVAAKSGRSQANISLLANSPAMQELVSQYRAKDDDSWKAQRDEYYDLIFSNGIKAARQIGDQLDSADEPDGQLIPINRLLAITADSSDRVGYSKKSTTLNVNVDFASKLEAARRRSIAVLDLQAEAAE